MKKIVILLLAPAMLVAAPQLQFLNKLDRSLVYAVGSKTNPPQMQAATNLIAPGKESKASVPDNPWILLYEQGKPENAFVYQFNTDGKSKLAIRIVASGSGSKIEPQTSLGMKIGGNVTPNDIIPVGAGSMIGKPQPVAAPKPAPAPVPAPAPQPVVEKKPMLQIEAPVVPQAPPLERPASIPQAPPLTQPKVEVPQAPPLAPAIPQAPPMGPVVPPAPPMTEPKVPQAPPMEPVKSSGPALSAELQEQIKAGTHLKKAEPAAQKTPDEREALLAAIRKGKELKKVMPVSEEQQLRTEIASLAPEKLQQLKDLAAEWGTTDEEAATIAKNKAIASGYSKSVTLKEINFALPAFHIKAQIPQAPKHETEEEWAT